MTSGDLEAEAVALRGKKLCMHLQPTALVHTSLGTAMQASGSPQQQAEFSAQPRVIGMSWFGGAAAI